MPTVTVPSSPGCACSVVDASILVHKLTLFSHNFMDACHLDQQRIDACVFMAMTQHGPLSMCAFNAQRDRFLLQPLQTAKGTWQPLRPGHSGVQTFPVKWLKGRSRAAALRQRGGLVMPFDPDVASPVQPARVAP